MIQNNTESLKTSNFSSTTKWTSEPYSFLSDSLARSPPVSLSRKGPTPFQPKPKRFSKLRSHPTLRLRPFITKFTLCYCSVPKSCLTLWPHWTTACEASVSFTISWSSAQTHVHWVSDAIQPSHPLSAPSPTALNLSPLSTWKTVEKVLPLLVKEDHHFYIIKLQTQQGKLRYFLQGTLPLHCSNTAPKRRLNSYKIHKLFDEKLKDFILGGSKITADGDCSHEIKRHLLLGRKAMTNLDSTLKSRDITLPTKVHLVKAMVLPVVMYGCENWTMKKAERRKIDAFELWCWRRPLRVPWTARRSNQSILKEISPGCSLEGLMLKLKL